MNLEIALPESSWLTAEDSGRQARILTHEWSLREQYSEVRALPPRA
jgi:hypothetical protein